MADRTPIIIKKTQGLIPIDSNNGIILETYVNFECLCRKCREKIPEKYYDIEKIKYCFNCGTKIDGKRANKIIKECKENVRGNFSELISAANKVCKECGGCTPYPFSVERCQHLKQKLLENTELRIRYRSVSVNSRMGLFCDEIIN